MKKRLAIILSLSTLCVISIMTYAISLSTEQINQTLPKSETPLNPIVQNAITSSETTNESDALVVLTENKNFKRQQLVCKEPKGEFKISRKRAIEIASEQKGSDLLQTSKRVTAIKTNLSDTTDVSPRAISDRPVWIVTFYETEMQRHGANTVEGSKNTVIADCNVVIDANTGDWLTTFSYNHS